MADLPAQVGENDRHGLDGVTQTTHNRLVSGWVGVASAGRPRRSATRSAHTICHRSCSVFAESETLLGPRLRRREAPVYKCVTILPRRSFYIKP